MSLTFHHTFSLDLGNISRLMDAVKIDSTISNNQIQDATGMGNEKVEPTIRYAIYCGLLERLPSSKGLTITKFGNIIMQYDKYLVSKVSHYAIHYKISNLISGATAWKYLIYDFLPKHSEFTKDALKLALDLLDPSLGQSSRDKNLAPLLNSYHSSDGLNKVNIFEEIEKGKFSRTDYINDNTKLSAYILAEIWDDHYRENRVSLSHDTLFKDGYFAAVMNMGEDEIQKTLNEMSDFGIIQQDREVPPYQIVKSWNNKYKLLGEAFS